MTATLLQFPGKAVIRHPLDQAVRPPSDIGTAIPLPGVESLKARFLRAVDPLRKVHIESVVFAPSAARAPMIETAVAAMLGYVNLSDEGKTKIRASACQSLEETFTNLQHPSIRSYGDANIRSYLDCAIHNVVTKIAQEAATLHRVESAVICRLR